MDADNRAIGQAYKPEKKLLIIKYHVDYAEFDVDEMSVFYTDKSLRDFGLAITPRSKAQSYPYYFNTKDVYSDNADHGYRDTGDEEPTGQDGVIAIHIPQEITTDPNAPQIMMIDDSEPGAVLLTRSDAEAKINAMPKDSAIWSKIIQHKDTNVKILKSYYDVHNPENVLTTFIQLPVSSKIATANDILDIM